MTTAQTAAAALWFLPFVVPIAIWVAWSDMARMKIPNKAVMTLVAVFAVVGLIALPLEVWAWRWVHLAVILAIGFLANMMRMLGAGDAKFAAAMAPFILRDDLILFSYLFAAALIAGFATHRLAKRIPAVRQRVAGWESWERKDFPMGLSLSGALVFYLVIGIVYGL
jgi:prepilin peptidase CpaA